MAADHRAPAAGRLRRFARRFGLSVLAATGLLVVAHVAVTCATAIEPPAIEAAEGTLEIEGEVRRVGAAYARRRGGVLEVRLSGSPEQIGHQHGLLLYESMVEVERAMLGELERLVPVPPIRWLLMDLVRVRHRDAAENLSPWMQREMAAQARAFTPDPFESVLPTYHRFVFLQSLYDIALGLEHSPLVGCTSLAVSDGARGPLVARAFDFEVHPVFDEQKVVFLIHEEGRIPYASVAWPGFVGVVTGMNREGLFAVVHGGRAGEPSARGEPVVHALRRVLATASTVDDAITALGEQEPMVSHLLLLADRSGRAVVLERAPGHPTAVREAEGGVLALTNHFEGPLADHPRNQRVRTETSTDARRERLDELLLARPASLEASEAVRVLRDRAGPAGAVLELGDRRAIDALIATHGVVAELEARTLWVSEGPHLAGSFLAFDLDRLLDPAFDPGADEPPDRRIAADETLDPSALGARRAVRP